MAFLLGFDPGHGDGDNVPPSPYNWYSEGTTIKQLALNIEKEFNKIAQPVFLTRKTASNPTLLARAKDAGRAGVKYLISLHTNYPNNGVVVYYSVKRPQDKDIAELIGKEIAKAMGINFRGAKVRHASYSTSSNPVDYYGIIRNSLQQGVQRVFIVEHGSHMEFAKDVQGNIKKITDVYLKLFKKGEVNGMYGIVKANPSLRLREGAGTNYKVITTIPNNTMIEILDTVNGWHKVKYGNKVGYVSGDYVEILKPISYGTVVNVSTNLNVRSGAGTNYSAIGKLYAGYKVEILEKVKEWYKIKYNSLIGYCHSDYISINKTEEPKPPAQSTQPAQNSEIDNLKKEIDTLKKNNSDLTAQVTNLQNEISSKNKTISNLNAEVSSLKSKINNALNALK